MPLPDSVMDSIEMHPLEDVVLPVLREAIPDVPVYSLIPETGLQGLAEDTPKPFILARRHYQQASWRGDPRFLDSGQVAIHTFTEDPDGDQDGAYLSEAVRVAFRNAWLSKATVPGVGSIVSVRLYGAPRRVTDWATASGPVQFADLPTGVWRYESIYSITIRRPL